MQKYDNFMIAVMDSAQSSDYWPDALLPMPHMQCLLWDELDHRPVTMRYATDEQTPPAARLLHVMASRGTDAGLGPHLEAARCYGPGKGQAGTTVWFRCGYGAPTWLVLEAVDR